eukprot:463084-Rhodomonas_salina.1
MSGIPCTLEQENNVTTLPPHYHAAVRQYCSEMPGTDSRYAGNRSSTDVGYAGTRSYGRFRSTAAGTHTYAERPAVTASEGHSPMPLPLTTPLCPYPPLNSAMPRPAPHQISGTEIAGTAAHVRQE